MDCKLNKEKEYLVLFSNMATAEEFENNSLLDISTCMGHMFPLPLSKTEYAYGYSALHCPFNTIDESSVVGYVCNGDSKDMWELIEDVKSLPFGVKEEFYDNVDVYKRKEPVYKSKNKEAETYYLEHKTNKAEDVLDDFVISMRRASLSLFRSQI